VVPEQTATLRAGPQTPVTRNGQAENTVFVYLWRVSAIENDEPRSVESHQPTARPDPEVVIGRLRKRLHRVFRQSILGLPHTASVAIREGALRDRIKLRGLAENECTHPNGAIHYG